MISTRYLPAICLLVALALVPTIIHSYSDETLGDGLTTATIPVTLADFASVPSGRSATWGKQRFDSDDWIERNYRNGKDEVRLTAVRSYDLKALYHHPELAVAYGSRFGSSFNEHEVLRFPARPDIPVHVLYAASGGTALGLYVLHYEGAYIEDPLWFQVRTAGELLFSRRKPMTLFFAHDLVAGETTNLDRLPSVGLLFAAIDHFVTPGR